MYNDNFEGQVKTHLSAIYTKAGTLRLDKQLDLTNNIFKTIVCKISRAYSFGITREFTDENNEQVYKDLSINKTMKEANRYLNAFNDVLLQVSWDYSTNKPRLIFRLPHKTKVELDEYDRPKEVEYFISKCGDGDKKEKWAYWSATEHYYKIYDGEEVSVEYPEGNEEGTNPYKVLPFVFMQNGFRDGVFFDEYSGDDLAYITLDNSVYSTFKNYLIKWQSFKQLVVTGSNLGELKGQVMDPSTALTASGQDVDISLLDLQADLKQLDETLQSAANNVAINYNISPSQFRLTGNVSSGFAMKMENKPLDEFTEEQQDDFRNYELALFKLLQIVSEVNKSKITGGLVVTFNKPSYAEAKTDKLAANTTEIDLGLKSASEIIAEERNITIDEAKGILTANLAERNTVYNKVEVNSGLNLNTTADDLGLN